MVGPLTRSTLSLLAAYGILLKRKVDGTPTGRLGLHFTSGFVDNVRCFMLITTLVLVVRRRVTRFVNFNLKL